MEKEIKARGRPRKDVPEVPDTAICEVRKMVKDYFGAKIRIPRYERKHTLFRQLRVDFTDYETSGRVHYDQHRASMLPEADKKLFEQYLWDKRTVFTLEQGVGAIKDETTRAVAIDTLLSGKSVDSLLDTYQIGRMTAFREKKRALRIIADFLLNHME